MLRLSRPIQREAVPGAEMTDAMDTCPLCGALGDESYPDFWWEKYWVCGSEALYDYGDDDEGSVVLEDFCTSEECKKRRAEKA